MNTILQTTVDQFDPITASSLNLLYEVTGTISEKTAALETAVIQRQLRFQQIYDHLRHSLHALHAEPDIYSLYKQSVTLLYNIYQNELVNRNLTPDLTAVQQWIHTVRYAMAQEITGKYLQNHDSIANDESGNDLLKNTFSGYLLKAISAII